MLKYNFLKTEIHFVQSQKYNFFKWGNTISANCGIKDWDKLIAPSEAAPQIFRRSTWPSCTAVAGWKKAFPIYFWYISNKYFHHISNNPQIFRRSTWPSFTAAVGWRQKTFPIYFPAIYIYNIFSCQSLHNTHDSTKIYTPMQLSKQSLLCHKSNFIYKIFRNYFLTSFELKYDSITLL